MARDRVSPRSAARPLCLSDCPLVRFLRLHFIVVRIFHTSLWEVLEIKSPERVLLDGYEG
jgi:hypothetical protein